MITNKVTPSERLKSLIELHAFKMKDFAEISGVYPTTLSRYVNGKQAIPLHYIKKAADILNVTPEYILCESDDSTPPFFQSELKGINQEMLDYNLQQFRFNNLVIFLKSMGVSFFWKMSIDDKRYDMDQNGIWHLANGIEDDYLDEIDAIKEMYRHPGRCKVWIEMYYKDRKIIKDYAAYRMWLKGFIAKAEIDIQELFGVSFNTNTMVVESDIDRALKGKDRLRWSGDDTFDIYEQGKNGENKPSINE